MRTRHGPWVSRYLPNQSSEENRAAFKHYFHRVQRNSMRGSDARACASYARTVGIGVGYGATLRANMFLMILWLVKYEEYRSGEIKAVISFDMVKKSFAPESTIRPRCFSRYIDTALLLHVRCLVSTVLTRRKIGFLAALADLV